MVNTCAPERTQQDVSPDYFRLGLVSICGAVTERHLVPKVVQDLFRTAPADILSKELPDIMKVLTKIGDESLLRTDLLVNVPNIAAQAVENSNRVPSLQDVIGDYLIPLVVRNLGSSDTGTDKAAQTALLELIGRGYVSKFQAEIKVCPSILALSKMESQLDVNTGAITLMSKLAPLLGKDITERIFLKRFTELCSSPMFYVRKVSASYFGHFCAVVGKDAFEKFLLPCYLALCQDEIWGVRKSCAEVIIFISCVCPADLRKTLLASAFSKLLQDECRWVRMSAFQTLGAFISTFAYPALTSIGYSSSGELVLKNQSDCEFQPGGPEGFVTTFSEKFVLIDDLEIEDLLGTPQEKSEKEPEKQVTDLDDGIRGGDKNGMNKIESDSICDDNKENKAVVSDVEPKRSFVGPGDKNTFIKNAGQEDHLKTENCIDQNVNSFDMNQTSTSPDKSKGGSNVEISNKEKHEDDLLCYNDINYWYISPPDIELDGLLETVQIEDDGSALLDVMTSQFENLSTMKVSDSSNDNIMLNETDGDNMGDNLNAVSWTFSGENVNNKLESKSTVEEIEEPPQKIVPQELIDSFLAMAHSESELSNDMSFHCAYALPAVILTLGKENWPLLKDTVNVLAGHMSYKIRRTIASSLHEIALVLGPEMATEYLTPLFEGFIKDLDEVRIGILKHLANFLQLITPEIRITYLPKLGEFLRVDSVCNWRFEETLAIQLTQTVRLFHPADIVKHIGLYAQALMLYNVAAVRQAAIVLVAEIVKHISPEHGLASSYLVIISERFAHSKKWKPRQTFALLCSEILEQNALDHEDFASVMLPHLLDLSWDLVANVRLVVARCIVKHIINEDYFMEPSNEHFESLENVLQRLQADKDRDVRMSAEYKIKLH